ncbi:MAG: hypothetical protein EBR71_02355 [Planctomycetes bacterium]|nr:hypothetical protein [Planctomycetota bacterium]
MRSNLLVGISSAVAAVAVAGSANAGLATGKIDGFTGTFAGYTGQGTGNSVEGSYANGTLGFNYRGVGTTGYTKTASGNKKLVSTANVNSVTGGNQVQALVKADGAGATGMTTSLNGMYACWSYNNLTLDSNGDYVSTNSFDMSNASSFTVSFANNTFGTSGFSGTDVTISIELYDSGENPAYWTAFKSVSGSGGTVTINAADFDGAASNWSNLGAILLYVNWNCPSGLSAGANLGNITLTDFSYNAVPAPGAAALVGMAGLITGRRRKA